LVEWNPIPKPATGRLRIRAEVVDVRQPSVDFRRIAPIFPAKTDVQNQAGFQTPVVLAIRGKVVLPVASRGIRKGWIDPDVYKRKALEEGLERWIGTGDWESKRTQISERVATIYKGIEPRIHLQAFEVSSYFEVVPAPLIRGILNDLVSVI